MVYVYNYKLVVISSKALMFNCMRILSCYRCRELQSQLNDADERNVTSSEEPDEVKSSREVLFEKLKQSEIRYLHSYVYIYTLL